MAGHDHELLIKKYDLFSNGWKRRVGSAGFRPDGNIWPAEILTRKIKTLYENIRLQAVANQRLRDEISSGKLIIVRSADALREIREP
jgi:hypothetical protein